MKQTRRRESLFVEASADGIFCVATGAASREAAISHVSVSTKKAGASEVYGHNNIVKF